MDIKRVRPKPRKTKEIIEMYLADKSYDQIMTELEQTFDQVRVTIMIYRKKKRLEGMI